MKRIILASLSVVLVVFTLLWLGMTLIRVQNERNEAAKNSKKADISVTLVEGKRREEFAATLDAAGITSYSDFLAATAQDEGRLFPDTYRFFPGTPATEVAAALKANFTTRLSAAPPTPDQLILASIVEREAKTNEERALIAGVYTNRLQLGMRLEADPTVQYGKDNLAYAAAPDPKAFSFWGNITQADYQTVISPFNTYRVIGLPPAPLCNPGKASIDAALAPAVHDYYYFAHRGGVLLLARTLAEHNENLLK